MTANPRKKDEAIKTYLRIKPLPPGEQCFLTSITPYSVTVRGQQQYTYDKVFDCNSSNLEIFNQVCYPIVKHSLEGYHACVLAYGQTASGKTHTMKGEDDNQGVIPLTLFQLFRSIEEAHMVAEIKISYIEIYNQNIIDLLGSADYLELREDSRKNITILGLRECPVKNVEEAMEYYAVGEAKRKVASNNVNLNSSRSHTILRINVDVAHDDYSKTNSCINMVDLAGSEGVSRTKAEGNSKKQGENINKSILALSNVIRGMSAKDGYVNFRDSKLTRILQSSFGNNSRSVVICTVNPIPANYQETINTLKFGIYASEIKLQIKRNISGGAGGSQRSLDSQPKLIGGLDILQPQQRVQFQENKRIIASLRQQNQQLRNYRRMLQQRIQFIELQNHSLRNKIEVLEVIAQKARNSNIDNVDVNEHMERYQREIKGLKSEMDIMADKYEAINDYSNKLEKNQRYLLERIAKYESEISILKDTAAAKTAQKSKTPVKPKQIIKMEKPEKIPPLTIGSMIVLKAQIIELKQANLALNQQIAGLVQQRNQLTIQLQKMHEKMQARPAEAQNHNSFDMQRQQIKNLHIRIKKLKNEINFGKEREKKLTKMLKETSSLWIEQFEDFNEWYAEKRKRVESLKKQKSSGRKIQKENSAPDN